MVGKGLSVAVPGADELTLLDVSKITKGMSNLFQGITKDLSGNIWILLANESPLILGLDHTDVSNFTFPMLRQGDIMPDVNAFFMDSDGDIWLNQNRYGLGLCHAKTQKLDFMYNSSSRFPHPDDLKNVSCFGSFAADPGCVWIGMRYSGYVYVVRKEAGKLVLKKIYDLSEADGWHSLFFHEDIHHNVWIATEVGLLVKPYGHHIMNTGLAMSNITAIAGDREGRIYVGCGNAGGITTFVPSFGKGKVVLKGKKTMTRATGDLPTDNISALCVGPGGILYIGTMEGHLLARSGETVNDLSFVISGYSQEKILNIVADKYGKLWISTNKAISQYDPKSRNLQSYTSDDGMRVKSFMRNSFYYAGGDRIYFGGYGGISGFSTETSVVRKASSVTVVMTDVKVNGTSILDNLLEGDYDVDLSNRRITIDADANNIEFDFSTCNYLRAGKIRYAYRLKGVDKDWRYSVGNIPFALYTNLSKGRYTLQLKATDSNGAWSQRITEYTILRLPAWYETWWAYTIYILTCLALGYWLYLRMKKRLRMRNELHLMQLESKKAEELAQAKLRYFTNVSHDFLTPITIVSCLIDDLEVTYRNKIPQLDKMRSSLGGLKRLIQQVLDFRKIENGKMKLTVSESDLTAFVGKICDTHFKTLFQKKHILFSYIPGQDLSHAWFDEDKVEKVLFNLLSNAYKYTDEGGGVTVTLSRREDDGHTLAVLCVKDTGKGIDAKDLEHIFTRFYTSGKGLNTESNGIGLSLVKEMLDIHHGSISVESKVGVGTDFTVTVPVDEGSYLEAERASGDFIEQLKAYGQPGIPKSEQLLLEEKEDWYVAEKNGCMLIAEDNKDLLDIMAKFFSPRYDILTAGDGMAALDILKVQEPDVIISDVMMPRMDGLELCRHLKSDINTCHIPIILLTAKATPVDRVECYRAGANGYVSKPFELKVLEARVENFFAERRERQNQFREDTETDMGKLDILPMEQQLMDSVVTFVKSHLSDTDLSVETLASEMACSKSSLYRKVKAITGMSPVEFIRNLRLKEACRLLKDKSLSVSDIGYACGFSSPKYFATCFLKQYGVTPSTMRKRQEEE